MSNIDPQVQASLISSIGGVIAGAIGGNLYGRKKNVLHAPQNSADRCEKICGLLVNSFDKLLTALEVVGEPPAIRTAIRDARDGVVTAKNYLGISETDIIVGSLGISG